MRIRLAMPESREGVVALAEALAAQARTYRAERDAARAEAARLREDRDESDRQWRSENERRCTAEAKAARLREALESMNHDVKTHMETVIAERNAAYAELGAAREEIARLREAPEADFDSAMSAAAQRVLELRGVGPGISPHLAIEVLEAAFGARAALAQADHENPAS